jgi:acyl-CoA dehydrogenase
MIELDDIFLDSFTGLLDTVSDNAAIRAVEGGGATAAIWEAVQESGFVDALLPEDAGGAGFDTATVVPLVNAAGERLLPVAFAQTMVARMLAARAGVDLGVEGAVTLWPLSEAGTLRSQVAPAAWEAGHALVQQGNQFTVRPLVAGAQRDGFGYIPAELDTAAQPLAHFTLDGVDLLDWASAITALLIAGACNKVLAMTIDYLNERKQFGRALSKFQAIQHNCAVMAEHAVIANTAARMGFTADGDNLSTLRVAVARSVTFDAAAQISALAHAGFAAIGITEEYDLQLYVRALKRWQVSFGSDIYWARKLGQARIAGTYDTSADFIRDRLAPEPVA